MARTWGDGVTDRRRRPGGGFGGVGGARWAVAIWFGTQCRAPVLGDVLSPGCLRILRSVQGALHRVVGGAAGDGRGDPRGGGVHPVVVPDRGRALERPHLAAAVDQFPLVGGGECPDLSGGVAVVGAVPGVPLPG